MKKLLCAFIAALCALLCVGFVACKSDDPDCVVINVTGAEAGQTLIEYMEDMKADGEIDYTLNGTLITSINGKQNFGSKYWFLYTDDAENANEQWGTYVYDGKTYGSAISGAAELVVKDGCTYIWAYGSI